MSALADLTVDVACSYLGMSETPPGSNRGEHIDVWLRHVGLDPTKGGYPWCAAAISYWVFEAAEELQIKPKFKKSARALGLLERNPSLVLDKPEYPCIGVIDHGRGRGHASLVVDPIGKSGRLLTVDGNSDLKGSRTGGSVVELDHRKVSDFCGFVRIA